LGNSDVGKSFLFGILIGRDISAHQSNATSATRTTESVDVTIGSHTFTLFNIPDLIEAEKEHVYSNKQEIDKAFAQRLISIVMFVFGQQGDGRLQEEDTVTFNTISIAYSFRSKSLAFIVTGLRKN
jgi:GTPase Era involved in 16S rRNA processing